MRKVIAGLVVVLIVCVGGYFGVAYWAQRAAAREVDAVLESWRLSVGTATRGSVEFDLWTRTLKVADVAIEAGSQGRTTMGQVVASGFERSGKARRLEIVDLEVSGTLPGQAGGRMVQKAPRVTLTDYSGRPPAPRKVASGLDAMRFWLEQFSSITAASIDIPSLTVTVAPGAADGGPGAPGLVEYVYSNMALRDVRAGRVALATVDKVDLRSSLALRSGEIKGEIGKTSIVDADVGPMLAFLDPSRARDQGGQGYQRIYRRLSMGPYTLRFGDGGGMSIDGIDAEDIGLRPEKLSLDDLVFLTEVTKPAGQVPSPAQLGMLMDKVAGLYEGIHLGKVEMRGFSASGMRDAFRIASLRIDGMENGRIGEFSMERLNGGSAAGDPLNLGRLAVKGLDIANLLRLASAQAAAPGQQPGLDRIVAMLALLDGIEIRDLVVPDPRTRKVIHLEAFNATWGRLVGGVPSQARVSVKFSAPIAGPSQEPFINMLAAAGIGTLAAGVDVGASWTEAARAVALEPATIEVGGLLAVSLKASAGNVPREVFSTDAARVMAGAALAEAGPVEVSLRDLGAVDLVLAELGRASGGGPEVGRAMLLEALARNAEGLAQVSPQAPPLLQAVGRFVQGKGETLTVALTPKGRVGVLQLVEAGSRDPVAAILARFDVEARTGR